MNAVTTHQFRDIAKETVENQQRVCAVQMKNIERKLDTVVEDMTEVKADVSLIKTEIEVIKTRFSIGAVVVGSLVGIIPLIVDLVRHLLAQ